MQSACILSIPYVLSFILRAAILERCVIWQVKFKHAALEAEGALAWYLISLVQSTVVLRLQKVLVSLEASETLDFRQYCIVNAVLVQQHLCTHLANI